MAVDLVELLIKLAPPVLAGGATALAAVKFLGEKAVDHALERRMEEVRNELARETALITARVDDSLHRATELTLGDAAAERDYRFEARKRLYAAIGPLRFQLLQAAILFRDRLISHARHPYTLDFTKRYYAQSTLYRLARLICLTELIERQIAIHDFSVDTDMLRLVRFRTALFDALSDGKVPGQHPKVDWSQPLEHLYRDSLLVIGTSMMTVDVDEKAPRAIRFDEFYHVLGQGGDFLQPLVGQLERLDPTRTPIFWLRLSAIAALCDGLLSGDPVAEALGAEEVDLAKLLEASADDYVVQHRADFMAMLNRQRAITAPASAN